VAVLLRAAIWPFWFWIMCSVLRSISICRPWPAPGPSSARRSSALVALDLVLPPAARMRAGHDGGLPRLRHLASPSQPGGRVAAGLSMERGREISALAAMETATKGSNSSWPASSTTASSGGRAPRTVQGSA
jgi:hypothetical protein